MSNITSHISVPLQDGRSTPSYSRAAILRRHAFIIPSFLLALGICAWFTTWGDGQFFQTEPFSAYYDAQARAMLHGRLDVPPHAIGFEAFVRGGKSYGYFGIAPALLRLPLVVLFPSMDGRWSRLFMLIACAVNLICAYRLVLRVRGGGTTDNRAQKMILSLFILCAGIGSTNVFIASRAYTYHEAIIWGGAFALLFADCLVSYLAAPRLWVLATAGVFAFLSFHSRATVGAGTLLALSILTISLFYRALRSRFPLDSRQRKLRSSRAGTEASAVGYQGEVGSSSGFPEQFVCDNSQIPIFRPLFGLAPLARPLLHALLSSAMIALTVSVYFSVNYAKFRTFDGVPLGYYARYFGQSDHLQVTGGKQFHPENVATGIASYFGFAGVCVGPQFPWFYMVKTPQLLGSPAIDLVEPYSCIPLSMPALLLLTLAGTWPIMSGRSDALRRLRRLRLPAVALLLGASTVLLTVGITERYLHDFYPFLIVLSAAGVCRIIASPGVAKAAGVLLVLSLISIVLNCSFALVFQRELVWGMPEAKRQELVHVRQSIDRLLHRTPTPAARE